MIRIKYFTRDAGGVDAEEAATLTVHDDLTHTISGARPGLVDLEMDALLPMEPGRVTFAEDPAAWARYIQYRLRTPFLFVVVDEDTFPPDEL